MRKLSYILLLFAYSGTAQAVCSGEAEKSLNNALKIEQEWPLRPTQDSATRYLQSLGERLALARNVPRWLTDTDWPVNQWRFSMVRDMSVNAFSIGDGRVYLTEGSFDFVNSEAELAAILAHEIAHQLAGHFCGRGQQLNGSARQIGSLTQVMDNTKEMQADYLALDILRSTGFPASAMLEVVKRLPLSGDVRQHYQRIEVLSNNLQVFDDGAAYPSSREFTEIKESLRQ
jgi:predicted Zn-dependent protease